MLSATMARRRLTEAPGARQRPLPGSFTMDIGQGAIPRFSGQSRVHVRPEQKAWRENSEATPRTIAEMRG